MASLLKILPSYTYDDYCQWEGHWELIDGIPYAMSPQPRPEHQLVATNIASEMRVALKKAGCNCKVYQPIDYKLSDLTVLNPDLLVVCSPITKPYLDFPPDVVVEILSPATALKDRHYKYSLYEQEKVKYYLIVDTDSKLVELFQLINDKYELQKVDQKDAFTFYVSDCSFDLIIDNIWD